MGVYANQKFVEIVTNIKNRRVGPQEIIAMVAGVILLVVVIMSIIGGTGSSRKSAVRIGYVGSETNHKWTGSYAEVNGTMVKTINPSNDELSVDIITNSGSIAVVIESTSGEIFYRGNDLETCSFSVKTKGKVKITITADKHSGAFSFE